MFEQIFQNKLLKTALISIVLVMIVVLTIPVTKDDIRVTLRNEITGVKEFKQTVNEVFIALIILAVFLPFVFTSATDSQKPQPKRMTLPQILLKVTREENIKFDLQEVTNVLIRGDFLYGQSTRNKNVWHLRYTDNNKHSIVNMAFYVMDDYLKFMQSPLVGMTTIPMGIEAAQNRLIKAQETAARALQTAEQFGITPEEVKRRLLQKEIDAQKQPEGDVSENEN